MTADDKQWIVAIIGALAWLPILLRMGYVLLVKPKLDIVIGSTGQLGYNSGGTLLNLDVAVRSQRKAALIAREEIRLTHESGRNISLLWSSINESLSQAFSSTGDQATYSRTVPAIAIQVVPDVEVRPVKVMFDDVDQRERANFLGSVLARRLQRMGEAPDAAQVEATDEYRDLQEFYQRGFQWEVGTYTGELRVAVKDLSKPVCARFSFELTHANVAHIESNQPLIEDYVRKLATSQEAPMPNWFWLYPTIRIE